MLSFTVLGQDCGFEAEKFRQLSTATYGRGHQLYMGVTISSMWAWSSALYGRGHQLCCRAMCYEMLHICQLHIHDAGIPLSTISPRHLIELRFGHYLSTVNFNNPTRGDLTFVTSCWKYPSRDWYTIGLKARTGPANCAKKLSPTQLHHYQLGNCILALLHQAQCRSWDAAE